LFSAKVELEKRKKRENDMNEVRMPKANKIISEKGTVFTGNALPFLTPIALQISHAWIRPCVAFLMGR